MKALTVWQPWASLIIAGAKMVEWRGWPCPRQIIGQRIAIHAAARSVRPAEIIEILDRIGDGHADIIAELALPLFERNYSWDWPRSVVLGTAIIGAPIDALDWVRAHEPWFLDGDRIDHPKFAWPLSQIERFDPPIPARGAQRFWQWSS